MKAAVLENKGILTKAVPTPEPGPGHVRLRIKAISIRGSDFKRYVDGHRMDPLILGYENPGAVALTKPNKAAQVHPRKYLALGRNTQVEIVYERIRIVAASGKAQ